MVRPAIVVPDGIHQYARSIYALILGAAYDQDDAVIAAVTTMLSAAVANADDGWRRYMGVVGNATTVTSPTLPGQLAGAAAPSLPLISRFGNSSAQFVPATILVEAITAGTTNNTFKLGFTPTGTGAAFQSLMTKLVLFNSLPAINNAVNILGVPSGTQTALPRFGAGTLPQFKIEGSGTYNVFVQWVELPS